MGLDMYLNAKRYIGANYDFNKIEGSIDIKEGGEQIKIPFNKVTYITCEAAYWRKSNQIHQFFVDNVQDGEDDCKSYYVERDQLNELIDLCKKDIAYLDTLETIDSEEQEDFFTKKKFSYKIYQNVNENSLNLPPQGGFFFGSTDIDEYFKKDLEDTIEQIEAALTEFDEKWDFEYRASW